MKLIDQDISIKDLWHKMQQEKGESDPNKTVFDLSSLAHKRILITGAAGYLGQYLIQVCLGFKTRPELILALDHNALPENSVSEGYLSRDRIVPTTKESEPDFTGMQTQEPTQLQAPQIISITGEAGDLELLTELHSTYAFDIIIHAAANKYLPQLEQQPTKALIQNTWATYRLIEFANEHKIPKFIYISTDKATEPSSIYGMSKLWPERHLAYCALNQAVTEYSVVRLGNLLGSTGSVLRLWEKEWDASGNITLRSGAVKRFFLLPEEAADGIWGITACNISNARWAIDSGKPWSIQDLAHTWLKLKGIHNPESHIKYTELLPGEKLSEALWEKDDQPIDYNAKALNNLSQFEIDRDTLIQPNSTLKYVPLTSPASWSQSALEKHQIAIKSLIELCEGTLEGHKSISNIKALNWFNHQKL